MGINKPEVRFDSFTEPWEERKIGEILTEKKRSIELEDNKIYELVTVKRRNIGVVSRGLLRGKDILVKNYFEIKAGDYIISKRQVIHGANGIVPQSLDKAIVSNEYLVCVGNENITTEFWMIMSMLPDMYKKFFLSSYGVDIEKLVFDVEDWKKRIVVIPTLTEQKKITEFFSHLDNLLTLRQRKHNKLVNLKKAMLEKMFPREGADVPEIRFAGFGGAWEKRKVGELGEIVTGSTPPTSNKSNYDGNYLFVSPADIQNNRYVESTITTLSDKGFYKGRILKEGATLFVSIGSTIGKVAQLKEKATTNQQINAIMPNSKYDNNFVFSLLANRSKQIRKLAATQAVPIINKTSFSNAEIIITTDIDEQTKIGEYFSHLDNLLTLHNQELNKLKQIKKSLLEKMFV